MDEPLTNQDAVRNLQRYLRRLSFEDNDILPVPIDGIFAERTAEALSEFQKMQGLTPTGTADKNTWDALYGEYSRLQREEDAQHFPDFFPRIPGNYETEIGENSAFISLIQFMLEELRIVYDTLPPLSVTGVYDRQTVLAVEEFQRLNLLPATGLVNRMTWNRMAEEYNQYVTAPL